MPQLAAAHLPDVDPSKSPARRARPSWRRSEPDAAAITGQMAAEVHGLGMLEPSIQDIANNTTRFLVIGHDTFPPTADDKTSLMFCVQDKPGALFSRWSLSTVSRLT